MTKGHLWELGKTMCTADFPDQLSWAKEPHGSLTLHQRKRLAQLAHKLRSLSHISIAGSIEAYLRLDSLDNDGGRFWKGAFPKRYMCMAAERLVRAIDSGETLRLGSLWGLRETVTPYKAISMWEDGRDSRGTDVKRTEGSANNGQAGEQGVQPAFVFTSSRPRKPNSRTMGSNDIDRHVSLEVEFAGLDDEYRIPRLHVRLWSSGLC